MSRRTASLLLLALGACSSSRAGDFSVDGSTTVEDSTADAPTADDAGKPVDAPVATDVPVGVDAPLGVDAPAADDAPADLDAPDVVDVPEVLDVVDAPAVVDARSDAAVVCRSSRECGALGLVCDPARMLCVECVGDVDCLPTQVCGADATCIAPRCAAGAPTCAPDGRVRTCDPRTGFVDMVCPAGMGCTAGRCVARTCTPNAVECGAGAERRTCSADGSTQTISACPAAPHALGRCVGAGACALTCDAGYGDCNGSTNDGCEADLRTSAANCSACGAVCAGGVSCVGGTCATCAAGTIRCAGLCVNPSTDAANCGGCGVVCPAGASCSGSQCLCAAGLTRCGASCVSTLTDPANCGGCGVGCATGCMGGVCGGASLTCGASTYDVNGLAADGCEVSDDAIAGHTQSTAAVRPSLGCSDTSSSSVNGARIVSDARTHSPPPPGFVGTVGAAPDWYSVLATGGTFCANNYGVTIVTSGGSSAGSCYSVTLITDRTTVSMAVSGSGSNTMSSTAFGLYTENSTVYFRVEKTCSLPVRENVSYTLSYHL
ncbi:MAG: Tryptophan synthase alpha chain [Myxococcaceae bacterium]|nr:Tryptophan synthase alpha chain [Myxococcaceae bacterium]